MAMPAPGPFVVCPVCERVASNFMIVRNNGFRFWDHVKLSCNHIFADLVYEEGGLVRVKHHYPHHIVEPKTIYDHGFNAFIDGVQPVENPYPGWWRTEKYNEWQRGWQEARRQAIEYATTGLPANTAPAAQPECSA